MSVFYLVIQTSILILQIELFLLNNFLYFVSLNVNEITTTTKMNRIKVKQLKRKSFFCSKIRKKTMFRAFDRRRRSEDENYKTRLHRIELNGEQRERIMEIR